MENLNIKDRFEFGYSEEYPSGFVAITKENAEFLQDHGWNVSFHTDNYLNTISAEFQGFEIGFGSWMSNLTAYIDKEDYQETIEIKSREELDKFLNLIQSTLELSCVMGKRLHKTK